MGMLLEGCSEEHHLGAAGLGLRPLLLLIHLGSFSLEAALDGQTLGASNLGLGDLAHAGFAHSHYFGFAHDQLSLYYDECVASALWALATSFREEEFQNPLSDVTSD